MLNNMSDSFYHGIRYLRINDGLRPIQVSRSATIGAVVTAPDADPAVFPLNVPVLIFGRDTSKIAKLGVRGTGRWVLDCINDQGTGALVVVVRVERAPKPIVSVLKSVKHDLITVIGELVNRASETDTDVLENADVNVIGRVYSGNTEYTKNSDYRRIGSSIKWLTEDTVETVRKRTSSVDPLQHSEKALKLLEVSQGVQQFQIDIDYQLHTEGIEWLDGNAPEPHTEYLVTYIHGKQPVPEQDYEVDYSHFRYESFQEIVNRAPNQYFDYLSQRDILRIGKVSQGDKEYVSNVDYTLGEDKNGLVWLSNEESETVNRGISEFDELIFSSTVLEVLEISQGVDIFTKEVDWSKTIDGKIEWLSSNLPDTGTDYVVVYTHGSMPSPDTDYQVDFDYKAGEIVALDRVIGGISTKGVGEGVHALIGPHDGVTPKLLIAPGFTHHAAVVQEFLQVAEENLGIIIADGPDKTNERAVEYRREFGSMRVYIVDPWNTFRNTQLGIDDGQPASARVAGLINKVDNQKGFWHSPSNKELLGLTGTTRNVPRTEGINSQANYLNEREVACITPGKDGGYILWGNRTCSNDPQFAFLSVVRTDDVIQEAIVKGCAFLSDKPINTAFFDTLNETVGGFLRTLSAKGAIILGDQSPVWIDRDKNSPTDIKNGKINASFDLEFVYPAEQITFNRYINSQYLVELFKNSSYVRAT